MSAEGVQRWSIDGKATVKIGEFSRGGRTRGDHRASDHDRGGKEKYVPCGIVDEASAALHITFGSSYKTSDFLVDTIEAKRLSGNKAFIREDLMSCAGQG